MLLFFNQNDDCFKSTFKTLLLDLKQNLLNHIAEDEMGVE